MGPGDPAAHRTDRLPLLPSGPGGIHRVLLHRARPRYYARLSPLMVNQAPAGIKIERWNMAERVGFEPTVPLPRRMLSKHVDSSTLAPLRDRTTPRGGILSRRYASGKVRRRPVRRQPVRACVTRLPCRLQALSLIADRPMRSITAIDRPVGRFYTAELF